ncbi:MAG: lipopolysaccharide heptosyltransferase I, partial [Anaerolineaceae bacterium]
MPMLKILLVKTSSMGDVIHNLPVVSDILFHFPDAEIDWVVEESFADIPALHPGVREIIPVAVRRWRRNMFNRVVHREISTFIQRLRGKVYDVVLDTQGLIKSAVITRLAHGARCGFDWHSAREPLAALFYDKTIKIEKGQHAVGRNRLLAGRAFGYELDEPVNYGVNAPALELPWLSATPFAVLLHATSRNDKLWPEDAWIALGRYLADRGIACVLLCGSETERQRSQRLATHIP